MKRLAILIVTVLFVQCIKANQENMNYWGAGIGINYSGLGFSYGLKTDKDVKFGSLGCIDYSSSYGPTCGVGIGWITTDFIPQKQNKHGLGVYLGLVGSQLKIERESIIDRKPIYGGSLGYHYFFNGVNLPGLILGGSIAYGDKKNEKDLFYNFSVGYSF